MIPLVESGKFILINIFHDWVELVELAKFDSASCNNTFRPLFLFILTTTTILYRTPQTHQVKHSFLIWIQKRLIFIDKLVLTNRILCFLWKFSNSEIKNHLKTIKSVCISTNKEFFLATCSFLKLVTNMEELEMTSFDDEMDNEHLAHVAGCCGKTLKVLKLNGFRKIPSSFGKSPS